ncbi:MAG TPA: DUF4082 domain-containing protein, partial [Tepidisphaeraceae bacterium]|nr:DUF4082 domain-containing protein [Tepidisphaeraceae bacterium]
GIAAAGGVELGLKFRSDVAGLVTGVRFYKGSLNTGVHTGELWTGSGQLLATATFTSETDSGWQQVSFSQPIAIAAGTTYIVSYHTTAAFIAYTPGVFTSTGVDAAPLHALANGVDGGNSVYQYGGGGFPAVYNGQAASYWVDVTFTSQPPASPIATSLWSADYVPPASQQNVFDDPIVSSGGVELGVKFQSDTAGFITGVRFWKGAQNTGPHTGELWTGTGQLLATATFTSESDSGWQQVTFSSPVAIAAGTTYIVSYHTSSGFITYVPGLLDSAVDNLQLHAIADGSDGGNSVYQYGPGGFPAQSNGQAAWYAVDVVFSANS